MSTVPLSRCPTADPNNDERARWWETTKTYPRLGLVFALDEPHELGHAIAVKVRWAERVVLQGGRECKVMKCPPTRLRLEQATGVW
jgi:hypothetical protein